MQSSDVPKNLLAGKLLTIDEAAELSGLGVRLLQRAIKHRRIGIVKLGPDPSSSVRIPTAALEAWLRDCYRQPVDDPKATPVRPAERLRQRTDDQARFPRQRRQQRAAR